VRLRADVDQPRAGAGGLSGLGRVEAAQAGAGGGEQLLDGHWLVAALGNRSRLGEHRDLLVSPGRG
jgi:hypothetical protein